LPPTAEDIAGYLNSWLPTKKFEATPPLTASVSHNTVTVTGSVTEVTACIELDIPKEVTVLWLVNFSCRGQAGVYLAIGGSGTFVIGEDAIITMLPGDNERPDYGIVFTYDEVTVVVSHGAFISNTSGPACSSFDLFDASSLVVSGKVYVEGNTTVSPKVETVETEAPPVGCAIYLDSNTTSLEVAENGLVFSKGTCAIISNEATIRLAGMVVAYGTAYSFINDTEFVDDGILLAWDKAAGNQEYYAGDPKDLLTLPEEASAVWGIDTTLGSGIAYTIGNRTGFFPVDEVIVTAPLLPVPVCVKVR